MEFTFRAWLKLVGLSTKEAADQLQLSHHLIEAMASTPGKKWHRTFTDETRVKCLAIAKSRSDEILRQALEWEREFQASSPHEKRRVLQVHEDPSS